MTQKEKKLQKVLKGVAMDYLAIVAELLERDVHNCYWIGADGNYDGVYDIADFGDTTFLTFDEMQVIVHNLDKWVSHYGSREAVGREVKDWCDWSIEPGNIKNGHARINLKSWLMGLREVGK